MAFKLCGIKVEITFLFVAFITFVISMNAPANVLFTILFSLLHEIGHLTMMILLKNKPKKIKFEIVGMNIIRDDNYGIGTKREIAISLGGPLMNFLVFIVLCVVLCFYENYMILTCACINLILMTFNLLPVKGLDGGTVLFFFLSQHFDNSICRSFLKITSIIFIAIIYLWAIYIIVITKYNFSLIIIAIFLTIFLFQPNDY